MDRLRMNVSETFTANSTAFGHYEFPLIFVVWEVVDKCLVVIANGITLIILSKYAMLEVSTNVFICCLTLADLSSAVALPFTFAAMYLPPGTGWTMACSVQLWTTWTTGVINGVVLCAIAVDRVIYLVYSLEYHTLLPVKRARCICVGICGLTMLYTLIVTGIGYRDASSDGTIARPCRLSFSIRPEMFFLSVIPFATFIPITIASYIKIGIIAWKQKRSIAVANNSFAANPDQVNDFKITKVMLRVLVIYIGCTIAMALVPVTESYFPAPIRENAFRIAFYVYRMNSWLNPMIYAWKSEKFRGHMKSFFRTCHAPNQVTPLF